VSVKFILKHVASDLHSPGKIRKIPGERRSHIHRGWRL